MNNNTQHTPEDILLRRYFKEKRHQPRENKWFTHRVIHSLPRQQKVCKPASVIMTVVTIVATLMCCIVLWYASHNFYPLHENKFSGELLCIYIAIMSTILLVVQQIIQLIKTYF